MVEMTRIKIRCWQERHSNYLSVICQAIIHFSDLWDFFEKPSYYAGQIWLWMLRKVDLKMEEKYKSNHRKKHMKLIWSWIIWNEAIENKIHKDMWNVSQKTATDPSHKSQNAPFCNGNMHTFLLKRMYYCWIWDWCIMILVQQVYRDDAYVMPQAHIVVSVFAVCRKPPKFP